MHRDSADALNRALDHMAAGLPVTGDDVDPELLATAQWLDDLGREVEPDPDFVARLEQELSRHAAPRPPAGVAARSRWRQRRSQSVPTGGPAAPAPTGRMGRAWASRAVAWGSWVIVIALIAAAVFGALRYLPERETPDQPAVAPGFEIDAETLAEMAAHPIVGAWTVDPDPGRPTRVIFHADGTYVEADPLQGTGVGLWRPTGERSGEILVEWPNRNEPGRLASDAAELDGIGNPAGTQVEYLEGRSTLRSTFAVSEDGATLAGTWRLEQFLPDGEPVPVEAEGEVTATRLTFDTPAAAADIDVASHPVVGAWTVVAAKGPPSMVAFHADGTYIEVNPLQGTGIGVWRPTGERAGEVIVEWPNRSEAARREAAMLVEGYVEGRTTLWSTFKLDDEGSAFAGTYEAMRYYPGGVEAHPEGPGDIDGTRIALDRDGSATSDAATHPLLGAWAVTPDPPGAAPGSLELYHPDGIVLVATSTSGTGVGVWQPAGDRSAEGIAWFVSRASPMDDADERTTARSAEVTVDAGATAFSGSLDSQTYLSGGTPVAEVASAELEATRLILEPGHLGDGSTGRVRESPAPED